MQSRWEGKNKSVELHQEASIVLVPLDAGVFRGSEWRRSLHPERIQRFPITQNFICTPEGSLNCFNNFSTEDGPRNIVFTERICVRGKICSKTLLGSH